jgi:hypothetical protein
MNIPSPYAPKLTGMNARHEQGRFLEKLGLSTQNTKPEEDDRYILIYLLSSVVDVVDNPFSTSLFRLLSIVNPLAVRSKKLTGIR